MAVSSEESSGTAVGSSHRWSIGVNVLIMVVAASALLVAVNWISSLKFVRRDIATLGNYGLSERTKRIISDHEDEIQLSLLYHRAEDDEAQQEYVDRTLDYCFELQRFSKNVKFAHVATPNQREKLVATISSTLGGEAEAHKNALKSFERVHGEIAADLEQRTAAADALLGQENAWISHFPLFAQVVQSLRKSDDMLKVAAEEIEALTPEGGVPKYGEASTKAKETLTTLNEHFKKISGYMRRFTSLADEVNRPDSRHVAMLKEVAGETKTAIDSLRGLIGQENEAPPEDIAAALKAYADRGQEVGRILDQQVRRADVFAAAFPIIKEHANWTTAVDQGIFSIKMEVGGVIQNAGQVLSKFRLQLLGIIDSGDPDQLLQGLAIARRKTAILEQNVGVCEKLLTGLAQSLTSLDPQSKQVLEAARDGAWFKNLIASIEGVSAEFEKLPELKMGTVADELKDENAVVVQVGDRIRVLDFGSVWPVRDGIPQGGEKEQKRTFNGDTAISSAILALTSEKPFANVILLGFEPPPPQQPNPFMRPPVSSIPTRALQQVKERLTAANFKVTEWNLAETKEKPAAEEELEEIFVVLPPAPPARNPFGQPPAPETIFSEQHRKVVRDLLDADARMIFLAKWELAPGGFGMPPTAPPYGYAPILEDDWGIKLRTGVRVVNVQPDLQTPDGFRVIRQTLAHMPVTGFGDHSIGKPLRGTRFLVFDACTINSEEVPEGVSVESVLKIPARDEYIGADPQQIIQIVNAIQNPENRGLIELPEAPSRGPFELMVSATRRVGEERKGRIVVVAFGGSFIDSYLTSPVVAESKSIRLEPAPTENLDLFVNAIYWLNKTEDYIGRGPVPVPRVEAIADGQKAMIGWFVWAIWPAVVLIPSVFLWYVRRR